MPEPHLLLDGLKFPEGPCFAPDGTLWWVEIEGGRIGCLAPEGPVFFEIGGTTQRCRIRSRRHPVDR